MTPTPFYASFLLSLPNIINEKKRKVQKREELSGEALFPFYHKQTVPCKPPVMPKFLLPKKYLSKLPHTLIDGYNIGTIKVHYCLDHRDIYVQCHDHGQYPWGHHRVQGAFAYISKRLNINHLSRNCCLSIHILVGLISQKLIKIETIFDKHANFIRNMLSSNFIRENSCTIKAFLRRFKLSEKVCFRRIIYTPPGFTLINSYFGKLHQASIYLIYRNSHFFLGRILK